MSKLVSPSSSNSKGEADAAFEALQADWKTLREECTEALKMESQAGVLLSVKERWRIPIVLKKLSKGKRLNVTDSKIWAAVGGNIKTQEDVDRVTNATIAFPVKLVPSAGLARIDTALRRSQTSSNSPCRTPNRSPMTTPRRGSVTPPRSRASSQRFDAGTFSSQSKAILLDEAASKKANNNNKNSKRFARSSSKGVSPKNSLIPPRSSSPLKLRSPSSDPHEDNQLGTGTGNGDDSEGVVSFLGQLAAAVQSTFSSKYRAANDSSGSVGEQTVPYDGATARSSKSGKVGSSVSILCRQAEDEMDQRQELLQGTVSTSPSFKEQYAGQDPHQQTLDLTPPLVAQFCPGAVKQAAPADCEKDSAEWAPTTHRKRRSYFGSLLASFISSGGESDSSRNINAAAATLVGSGEVASEQQAPPSQALSAKPSMTGGSGKQAFFGGALTSWLHWGHQDKVVPV
jgi:hypothetical protein